MKKLKIITIILLFFNAISGIFGGLGLILSPSGKLMQIPIVWLSSTPFNNFLIPGLILFIFIGLLSLFAGILTILENKYYDYLIISEGIILFIWLSVEIIMIRLFYPPLHVPYYLIAFCLINFGYILNKRKETR
jgi:hypothetical protein